MLASAIVVLGFFAFPRLAVALLPAFSPPVVTVNVTYGNVAPETMETAVTRPIENAVSRVAGIDLIQSDSFRGQSVVRAQFKFGTDINVAAVDVQQQVARIRSQLPNDTSLQEPQIQKADPSSFPVVRAFIADSSRTQRDLADLLSNELADEFAAIPGVGSVGVGGGQQRAITIEPDASALAVQGLTADAIVKRIKDENVDLPAGIVQIGKNEFGIRADALFRTAEEMGAIVVATHNGAPIFLRDVARVRDSIQEQRVFNRLDGVPAASIAITAQPDANVVGVAYGIYSKFAEFNKRYPTMHFGIVFDQRGFIEEAISALEHTALYGAILSTLVIFLFLHSWRTTLIVAISLPVSILGTLFAAYTFHETLNVMTLGGLALAVGLIIDDSVVVIENIDRHLEGGEAPLAAAERATAQIFSAVMASSITVVVVFVPLILIPGLQGLIFGPFAIVVMTGIAISLLVAVTTVPMLASNFLRADPAHGNGHMRSPYQRFSRAFDRNYRAFAERYRRFLGWAVDHPAIVLPAAFGILVVTVIALRFGIVSTETFPASDSRFVRFDVRTPNGTAVSETNRISQLVEAQFRKDPRVETVGVSAGSGFGGGVVRLNPTQALLQITLRPGITGRKAGAFVQEWQRRLSGPRRLAPGAAPGAGPVPADAAGQQLTDAARAERVALRKALVGTTIRGRTIDIVQGTISQGQDALQVQIYGNDIAQLAKVAGRIMPTLGTIPGVLAPDTNITASQPELDVKIDRRRAAQFGVSTGELAQAISTATTGTIASFYQLNGVQYPIIVELPPEQRRTFDSLQGLRVTSSAGASIPLTAVADVKPGLGPSQISRQNKQRRIDINAPIVGRPLGDVVAEARTIMERISLPSGYRWQFGPAITQNADTFSALGLVVLLAIVLIYMLLAAQFESYVDPLIIMFAVPLSLIGIVGSLVVTHRAFGLTAFIGALLLVGIAVKNAILVVEFTRQLRRDGLAPREAIMQAAPLRLRPILMTTLATLGGMLPLAIGIEAGSSTQAPLGTVVIGGLITSTMLTLIVIPTLYILVHRRAGQPLVAVPTATRRIGEPPAPEPAAVS